MEIIFVILGILFLPILLTYLLIGIGLMKMFKKAGKPEWPAFVPIYNTYILCQIVGVSPWWILIPMVGAMIPVLGAIISPIATIYSVVIIAISTARSFGKEDSWAIGIILLKPIFYLIIGFDGSTYNGPKGVQDVILESLGLLKKEEKSTYQEANYQETDNSSQRYCINCGTPRTDDSKYCANCGKEF